MNYTSRFIQQANAQGRNQGYIYFLGAFISFFIGQIIGAVPLMAVLIIKGRFDIESIMNPDALGISYNLYLALMLVPFVCSMILLMLYVRLVHARPVKSLITPFHTINWKKLAVGFIVWTALLAITELISYLSNPSNYILQFQPSKFLILTLISIPLLFIQTAYEEVLFRGYLMQWMGKYFRYPIIPVIITGIVFGAMHMMNPEVSEFGNTVMIDYISIGLTLGIVTLLSDSLELAMGLHFANNLFLSLIVTFDSSVLQTDAVFRIKEMHFSTASQLTSVLLLIIFALITSRIYPFKPLGFLFRRQSLHSI